MRGHIDVLGWLHVVWGGLGVLTGVSLGVLALGMHAALLVSGSVGRSAVAAVWLLVVVGALLGVFGAVMVVTGRGLLRRAGTARLAAIILAVPNLVLLPYGTALGVYAFWTLLNNDARVAFGQPLREAPTGTSA